MANFYDDNADLRFYMERGIDWEPLVRLTENDFRDPEGPQSVEEAVETYRDVMALLGEFVGEEVAPKAAEIDRAHPTAKDGEVHYPPVWDELFEQIKELEVHGICVPRSLGGLNLPLLMLQFQNELFARADVSVCAHHGFHGGIAMAAMAYSTIEGTTEFDPETGAVTKTRFEDCIREIVSGEAWGSMDITEPDAGSDMAALTCKGELEDGQWFVSGTKIYITSGHGRWHFVIARTEPQGDPDDPFSGLGGLSMFLVPAWDDEGTRYAFVDSVEEKLGHNGSATCVVRFEKAPAHLVGERGEGFKYMLLLMNGARVGVGFESLGLCEAAYRAAKAYAAERVSMGKTIDQHEMIADYLDEMYTDTQAIRAMAVSACIHEEMQRKLQIKLDHFPPSDPAEVARIEKEIKRRRARARHLTPLLKYYASEKAVEMARRAIQIHGGAGYITEYGVEKLLRDAVVMPIYEGTSQIQALMAMKDALMGIVKNPRRFARQAAQARWNASRGSISGLLGGADPLNELQVRLARLQTVKYDTLRFLLTRLAANKFSEVRKRPIAEWSDGLKDFDPKRDFALAMLHAERLIKILIDVAVAEELFEQAKKHADRQEVLARWLERAEPRVRFLHDEITTTGLRLLRELGADVPDADGSSGAVEKTPTAAK
jgi:alkylation response protein AidB-like acyl-CoA dehydrogenase